MAGRSAEGAGGGCRRQSAGEAQRAAHRETECEALVPTVVSTRVIMRVEAACCGLGARGTVRGA